MYNHLCLWLILFCATSTQAQVSNFNGYDFSTADSVAAAYKNHSITDIKNLSFKLTNNLNSDIDKFRAIFKWVCDNIENDYELYDRNKRMREKLKNDPFELKKWNHKFYPKVFSRLQNNHKTICTGYAYLIKELTYWANIESEIIDGYGRTAHANIGGAGIPNHSWNSVKLNDQWYLCDPTWASGSIDPEQSLFIKQFNEGYFLSPPELFYRNHYPLDSAWLMMDPKPTLLEFLNGPLIYKGALNQKVNPADPSHFEVNISKGETLTFRLQSNTDLSLKQVEIETIQSSTSTSSTPDIYQDKSGLYCFDQIFKYKGTSTIHILIENEYAFTYSINVQK